MRILVILLLAAALVSAQTPPNSVTVTSSRNSPVQPDQVVFEVGLMAGVDSTLDSAVAALQGSGVTAANYVQGQVSQSAQQSASLCPLPATVSDARAQARGAADTAGVRVGPVVSLPQEPDYGAPVREPFFRSGEFAAIALFGVVSPVPLPTATGSITVQFKLLR